MYSIEYTEHPLWGGPHPAGYQRADNPQTYEHKFHSNSSDIYQSYQGGSNTQEIAGYSKMKIAFVLKKLLDF